MTRVEGGRPTIPLADPDLGEREVRRVCEVVSSGQLAAGESVEKFQEEFAEYCGAERAVAASNGTTALHAALEALGIGEGDTVVTTPLSFVATANAVRLVGAEPIFADVDPETYTLDPDAVEERIREAGDVDAILAVHLYGLPAAMDRLSEIADAHDAALIEDACQAHGAEFEGERVGSIGDVGCFSFYPTKNMTTGEGGMIVTDRDDVAERAAAFVNHGRDGEGNHERLGHNFRMTDLAAAIGRVQLQKLPEYTEARRENARRFTEALGGADAATDGGDTLVESDGAETAAGPLDGDPAVERIVPPVEPDGRRHVYHQYTVRCRDRADFREHLSGYGVDTAVYYPTPIHEEPAYDDVDADLPVAERAAESVVSLPVHPNLSKRDRRAIATALAEYADHADD